jgi:hypothetical protein
MNGHHLVNPAKADHLFVEGRDERKLAGLLEAGKVLADGLFVDVMFQRADELGEAGGVRGLRLPDLRGLRLGRWSGRWRRRRSGRRRRSRSFSGPSVWIRIVRC